ncbi:MAG: hypothetical protein QM606_05385, partial [Leucobacter sp.]
MSEQLRDRPTAAHDGEPGRGAASGGRAEAARPAGSDEAREARCYVEHVSSQHRSAAIDDWDAGAAVAARDGASGPGSGGAGMGAG